MANDAGVMLAWGAGTQGQLGNGTLQDALLPSSVILPVKCIVNVVCGASHTVCLTDQQDVYAWGAANINCNDYGDTSAASSVEKQLQPASSMHTQQHSPKAADKQAESTAAASSCGTTAVWCVPQLLALPTPGMCIKRVAAGWEHTLFVTENNQLLVAGDNHFGQLGLGQQVQATSHLMLVDLQTSAPSDSALPHQHMAQPEQPLSGVRCQQLPGQQVPGQQASGYADGCSPTSQLQCQHTLGRNHWDNAEIIDVAAGMRHSLVLLRGKSLTQQQQQPNGGVWEAVRLNHRTIVVGWGANRRGQLGPPSELLALPTSSRKSVDAKCSAVVGAATTGMPAHRSGIVWLPALLTGSHDADISQLTAGGERSAGITGEGSVLLWGRPLEGITAPAPAHTLHKAVGGTSVQFTELPQPTRKAEWSTIGSTKVGCVPAQAKTVDDASPSGPEQRLAWVHVSLGWRHLVALDVSGQVWTAGNNTLGQLGIGQQQSNVTLGTVQQADGVTGLHYVRLPGPAKCVAAGAEHSAALLSDGSMYVWGWGEHGQLGTGGTCDEFLPQLVQHAGKGNLCTEPALGSSNVDASSEASASSCPSHSQSLHWLPCGISCGSGFTVVWKSASL